MMGESEVELISICVGEYAIPSFEAMNRGRTMNERVSGRGEGVPIG